MGKKGRREGERGKKREKGREKERQVERQVKRGKLNSYADVRYMYVQCYLIVPLLLYFIQNVRACYTIYMDK